MPQETKTEQKPESYKEQLIQQEIKQEPEDKKEEPLKKESKEEKPVTSKNESSTQQPSK